VAIPAQRGEILDRTGKVLVSSTKALAVQIIPTDLPVKMSLTNIHHPPKRDDAVFARLAHVLHFKTKVKRCTIYAPNHRHPYLSPIACLVAQQLSLNPFADVTVKSKVSKYVQYYIAERQNDYQGIQVQQTSIPGYPGRTLAAQVLGTVGQISRRARSSARPASRPSTTSTCAALTASSRSISTHRASRLAGRRRSRRSRATACRRRWTLSCSASARTRSRSRCRRTAAAPAARSSR